MANRTVTFETEHGTFRRASESGAMIPVSCPLVAL